MCGGALQPGRVSSATRLKALGVCLRLAGARIWVDSGPAAVMRPQHPTDWPPTPATFPDAALLDAIRFLPTKSPPLELHQFRKKKEKRGPGKKAEADADAEAEEEAGKEGANGEEAVPESKSPVGLKLLAGESGSRRSAPFEVAARSQVEQCNSQGHGTAVSSAVENADVVLVQEDGDGCNVQSVGISEQGSSGVESPGPGDGEDSREGWLCRVVGDLHGEAVELLKESLHREQKPGVAQVPGALHPRSRRWLLVLPWCAAADLAVQHQRRRDLRRPVERQRQGRLALLPVLLLAKNELDGRRAVVVDERGFVLRRRRGRHEPNGRRGGARWSAWRRPFGDGGNGREAVGCGCGVPRDPWLDVARAGSGSSWRSRMAMSWP